MPRLTRVTAVLTAALAAGLVTNLGAAAYARTPAPDSNSLLYPDPPPPVPLKAGIPVAQALGWMLLGAAVAIVVAATCYGITAIVRRRNGQRLRMS
jgi:hypothetical protein